MAREIGLAIIGLWTPTIRQDRNVGCTPSAARYGWIEIWVAPHLQLDMAGQKCGLHPICSWTWLDRNVGCTPLAAGILPTVASSQGNYFFLALIILESGSGSWEGSIFFSSLRTPLVSMELFSTARNIYYLPWLKSDKIFKRIFLSISMVKSWPNKKLIFRAW